MTQSEVEEFYFGAKELVGNEMKNAMTQFELMRLKLMIKKFYSLY